MSVKVLHLSSVYAPSTVGGAERVVQMLAERMVGRGVSVGVAHLVPEPEPRGQMNGVDVFPLAHRNPLWIGTSARFSTPVRNANKIATLFNVLTARDLAKLLDEYAPDVLHSHSMVELTPWMWQVARRRKTPIVHTLHDFDLLCIRAALFKDGRQCVPRHRSCVLFSEVKKRYHGAIGHIVGVSQSILDIHLEAGLFAHLPAERRHVVWNPVAASPACGGDFRSGRQNETVFGFLGRLVPEKGIDVLLEACRILGGGGWRLLVAGRAPSDDDGLRCRAAGLPITFVGYVDPAAFLRQINVLVAPAIWSEPFGLTVVEALAAGIPVIGSNIGGVAEIIRTAEPRWLAPPHDVGALAERMAGMMAARSAGVVPFPDVTPVLARTDPDYAVDRYLSIYETAVSAGFH